MKIKWYFDSINNIDGVDYVKDNKIIIKNPIGNGRFDTSLPLSNWDLFINGEKIDYIDFNSITSVKANEILAEIIKGQNGIDRKNVFS